MTMTINEFIAKIKNEKKIGTFTHHEVTKKARAKYKKTKKPLSDEITKVLSSYGIDEIYSHQAKAIDIIRDKKNLVIMSPTASGKSLIYNIPVIEGAIEDKDSHALYIFPLKGLSQDQMLTINALGQGLFENRQDEKKRKKKNYPTSEIYDGDTSSHRRKTIRDNPPPVVITTPDMLHFGLCAYHEKWEKFFKGLKYIVIDEIHTYRGVLGSHMAEVIRRLRRITDFYGAKPIYIACSATIANPKELAETLTGLDFTEIIENGAPRAKRNFIFLNPIPEISPYTVATKLFSLAVEKNFRTIAFTKSRKITELMNTWVKEHSPKIAPVVSSYRAGYLPEERREIESRLFSGELRGVITTSALELGVDIGGLDICILVGYPGSISSTLQRAGRVGRGDRDSLIIFIALDDALDQFFMRAPKGFFKRSVEAACLDDKNKIILKAHLPLAVAERPMDSKEKAFDYKESLPILEELTEERQLWYSPIKYSFNPKRRYPHSNVSIRGTSSSYRIFSKDVSGKPRLLGTSGASRVLKELHPGAIYLHRGEQYIVTGLHMGTREVTCKKINAKYHTSPITDEETVILKTLKKKKVGGMVINLGELQITERVLGYRRKEIHSKKILDEQSLELPPDIFKTTGVWTEVDGKIITKIEETNFNVAGGLHALEHAAIATLPLFALCDRRDLGGVSYTLNPELNVPAIFIYDGVEGGIGLTKRGFDLTKDWMHSTLKLMKDCPCEEACPSCTQDPHCGNNNEPLDKRAALIILSEWLNLK
ncbi:MAG: DEAD/DEAH box helicase [Deltaproteobacteria bacterium]|nr:DEAD/DEAH box helicase [Deltaproteobacteria bacterium]